MASTGIIQVANETESQSSRITKEGKKITYCMKVIQQPERARACGSGAKSSADRRPVDPPPIVELRIYEGENEITFSYNANFFLFATLENARHVAQGRVAPPTQPAFPVLTGTPVAGMAYLDRPAPAGYFIFPDLSVRHEGKYRLSFSLYEELKEQKDMDSETPQNAEIQKSAHVSHRLEVKSVPFTVFSAKKFPGLTESTALSRMVAEQGCRVRIRRDVRMRRRENKSNRDFDEYDEENTYDRARQTATPDAYNQPPVGTPHTQANGIDRPRSVSNTSQSSYMPDRRSSMEQMSQAYQQPPPQQYTCPMAPQTPSGMYPPQMPQWQPQQAPTYMQPPPPSYPPQQTYQQPAQSMDGQYNGFMPPQYPAYNQQGHMRHTSMEFPQPPTGPPRPSSAAPQQMPQYPTSSQSMAPYQPMQPAYSRPPPGHSQAPSLQPLQIPQSLSGAVQPMSSYAPSPAQPAHAPMERPEHSSPYISQAPTSDVMAPQDQGYYSGPPVPPKYQNIAQPTGATKRTYSASFDTQHMDQPLRHGARPPMTGTSPKFSYGSDAGDEDPSTPLDEAAMSYRRADGTERRRRIPAVS
ncbi:hypothetical protein EJ08DRAFT_176308 [Tothia fuscella]|uniref:Velvet domain-containing protein n=1 Tax=Tothia fuscella TaxID=1048955 RepID=A0A9P4TS29_9PEZI|nr:hypothetical protein EJ08DRAFT_176308 [Tothia fuscella]